ncbi:MAG: hypothetical protein JSV56_07035 [Methanomassiliicoccales archaeon]|nr:MAG: hypothetical protein JSV56_07035 [Methanomassiliicoccales archaeon]
MNTALLLPSPSRTAERLRSISTIMLC